MINIDFIFAARYLIKLQHSIHTIFNIDDILIISDIFHNDLHDSFRTTSMINICVLIIFAVQHTPNKAPVFFSGHSKSLRIKLNNKKRHCCTLQMNWSSLTDGVAHEPIQGQHFQQISFVGCTLILAMASVTVSCRWRTTEQC